MCMRGHCINRGRTGMCDWLTGNQAKDSGAKGPGEGPEAGADLLLPCKTWQRDARYYIDETCRFTRPKTVALRVDDHRRVAHPTALRTLLQQPMIAMDSTSELKVKPM